MLNEAAALVAVAVLGWAAWSDIKTRRVRSAVWRPGFEIAIVFLVLHGARLVGEPTAIQQFDGLRILISVGLLGGLGVMFAALRLFGWADAKAFILLGVLVPLFPTFTVFGTMLPLERSVLNVFSLTVVSNGLLLTLVYPLYLGVWNIAAGTSSFPWVFLTKTMPVSSVTSAHGKLVTTPSGNTTDGLDLDALRMYLRWRDVTLEEIRDDPSTYRSENPTDTYPPTDGRILNASMSQGKDEWAADAFLAEHDAYGTSPATLRKGLEALASEDEVQVMPGIPLIVSLFAGLVTALIFGDIIALLLL